MNDKAPFSLAGRRAVIVGGSSGIGFATAQCLRRLGAEVTIGGRDRVRLADAQSRLGDDVKIVEMDARSRASTEAAFTAIGPIDDVIIAASGGKGAGPFRELAEDELRKAFDAKFWAHWNTAQSALRTLEATGTLTFVVAASSRFANPGTAGLAAVNGAIDAMVPTLARELAPIRVNGVSPGVIDTPWWNGFENREAIFAAYADAVPAGRIGIPDDVARAIAFLLCDSFVTGVVLDVDGGLRLAPRG
jgi:NAD(P)-dependent dehydrogenase (short-subunit alcohol dehydrogenase family)